jgi:hypothetical protein
MESLDYWRLCDELSVIQAVLLITDCDPSRDVDVEGWGAEKRPVGYEAAKTAISNALRRGAITGKVIPIYEYDIHGDTCGVVEESIDIAKSRIEVDSLRMWLAGRGLKTGFFFPVPEPDPSYLSHFIRAIPRSWPPRLRLGKPFLRTQTSDGTGR